MSSESSPHGEAPQVGSPASDAMILALRRVIAVLRSEKTQEALAEHPEKEATRLGLPTLAGPLLLNILNTVEQGRSSAPADLAGPDRSSSDKERSDLRDMLLVPFGQITWTFRILTGMSVTMFLVGIAFMVVALIQSVNERDVSSSTVLIAGVGLVDLVVLFYRRPWEDISRGLSNSQQARIVATSYLSGLSKVDWDNPNAHTSLQTLTREAVELLEHFTEPFTRTESSTDR